MRTLCARSLWLCVVPLLLVACGDDAGNGGSGGAGAATGGEASSGGGAPDGGSGGDSSTGGGSSSSCGDGIVDEGESCDDGNQVDSDGCNRDCVASGALRFQTVVDTNPGADDMPTAIASLEGGRIVVTGWARNGGALDIPIAVLESDGAAAWTTLVDGPGVDESEGGRTDRGIALAALAGGDFVLAGYTFFDDLAVVPTEDEYPFVRRYTSDGEAVWTKQAPSTPRGRAYAVAVDADQNIYVGGTQSNPAWLRSYNENGAELWTIGPDAPGGGCNGCDAVYGVAVDGDGRLVVAAGLDGTTDGDTWVASLTSAGDASWSDLVDYGGQDYPYALGVDAAGDIYFLIQSSTAVAIEKRSSDGSVLWHLDGPVGAGYSVNTMAVAPNGDFVLAGSSYVDSVSDTWITRYDPDGGVEWQVVGSEAGLDAIDISRATITQSGDVAVTGPAYDDAGDLDFWVAVLAP